MYLESVIEKQIIIKQNQHFYFYFYLFVRIWSQVEQIILNIKPVVLNNY